MDSEEISMQDNNLKLDSTSSSRKEPLDVWKLLIYLKWLSHINLMCKIGFESMCPLDYCRTAKVFRWRHKCIATLCSDIVNFIEWHFQVSSALPLTSFHLPVTPRT